MEGITVYAFLDDWDDLAFTYPKANMFILYIVLFSLSMKLQK